MRVIERLNTIILLILIFFTAYIRYFTDFFIQDRALLDALLTSLVVILLAYTVNSLVREPYPEKSIGLPKIDIL